MTITTRSEPTDEALSSRMASVDAPKVNGPALAALLAAGIGAFMMGFFTTFAVISVDFKNALAFNKGVGPLAGKTTYTVIAWLLAWAISFFALRGKDVNARPFYVATFVLVGLGVLGTFPLFFDLFGK